MTRIQLGDFDVSEEIGRCTSGRSDIGGIVTFVGTVRDSSHSKKITGIELTSYSSMAEKQLAKLRRDTMEFYDIINLTVVHRIGELKPGERIVCIVVAARHRKSAFEACGFAIDELKRTVPIWKKEYADDGEWWVEAL